MSEAKAAAMEPVDLGRRLELDGLVRVAEQGASARISEAAREAMASSREVVDRLLAAGAPATYGINTGFGALAEVRVAHGDLVELQYRLLRSHAVGVGAPLDRASTRALMVLRAHVLGLGQSGVRPVVAKRLTEMLDAGVHPVIPAQGSVGASGDLAPLAHLALVLVGEGRAELDGVELEGDEAMRRAGVEPLALEPKEGLSLINGTQGMLAVGGLALVMAERLAATADVTGSLTLEALQGSVRPFDAEVVGARPQPGALEAATHLRELLAGSEIVASHAHCGEVQDAYSLRCMPQVHGSARDLLAYARGVLDVELNAVTDNPIVLADGRIESGGNFHGQPVAAALDAATLAVADLASIAERRIAHMVDSSRSRGLPPFLAAASGLDSGFMMAQVTAAALVAENRALAQPTSADSVPTSAEREDHVSMGMASARHFAMAVDHLAEVLAIEAVVAAEGVRHRGLRAGDRLVAALERLAQRVPPVERDRAFHRDFSAARELIRSGGLLSATSADEPRRR